MSFIETNNPQVGDLVEIINADQTKSRSKIVSIKDNIIHLQNQTVAPLITLTWLPENRNWQLSDGLIPNQVKFYIASSNRFPFYNLHHEAKVQILVNASDNEFQTLFKMLSKDEFNDLVHNRVYKERLQRQTTNELFLVISNIKESLNESSFNEILSWKQVYNEFALYLSDTKYNDSDHYFYEWFFYEHYFCLELYITLFPKIDLNYLIYPMIRDSDIKGLKWLLDHGFNNFENAFSLSLVNLRIYTLANLNIDMLDLLFENGLFKNASYKEMKELANNLNSYYSEKVDWMRKNKLI